MRLLRHRSNNGNRRAAACVEAAVVLPVMLTFCGGILDLGHLTKVTNAVANGARNGAQTAAVNKTAYLNTAVVRAAVLTDLANLPNVTSTNPTINITTSVSSGYTYVKVQVVYDLTGNHFTSMFPVSNIQRTSEMRQMPSR